jgi:hypothetical protein
MKWDQIETKWTLMTRRIRADLGESRTEVTTGLVRTLDRRGTVKPSVADTQLSAPQESESKTSAQ